MSSEEPIAGSPTVDKPSVEDNADLLKKAEDYKAQATTHYKAGDFPNALKYYTLGIETHPDVVLYSNRAAVYMMLNKYEEASADCQSAIALDPEYTRAYVRGGRVELALGNIEKAISLCSSAISKDPGNDEASKLRNQSRNIWTKLGAMRGATNNGEYQEAVKMGKIVLDACTQSVALKKEYINVLLSAGKLKDANEMSSELSRSSCVKSDPSILHLRAKVLFYQGHAVQAMNHLQLALRADPDSTECAKLLRQIRKAENLKEAGNTAFKENKYAEAFKIYGDALEIDPKNKAYNARLHTNRAATLMREKKHGEAIEEASRAIELDPGYVKAYIRRAQAYVAMADKESLENALRDYNKGKDIVNTIPGMLDGANKADAPPADTPEASIGTGDDKNQLLLTCKEGIKSTRVALKEASKKDYYKILGLDRASNPSDDDIRKAYRKAALKWHPDRHATATEAEAKKAESMFKDVNEANDVLSDPNKRRLYDAGRYDPNGGGDADFAGGMGGMGGMGGGMPVDLFDMLFSGGMGGMGGMGGFSGGGMGGGGMRGGGPNVRFQSAGSRRR